MVERVYQTLNPTRASMLDGMEGLGEDQGPPQAEVAARQAPEMAVASGTDTFRTRKLDVELTVTQIAQMAEVAASPDDFLEIVGFDESEIVNIFQSIEDMTTDFTLGQLPATLKGLVEIDMTNGPMLMLLRRFCFETWRILDFS